MYVLCVLACMCVFMYVCACLSEPLRQVSKLQPFNPISGGVRGLAPGFSSCLRNTLISIDLLKPVLDQCRNGGGISNL